MTANAQHCDVQRGDSMWRIAKRYNVLFKDVLELNKHLHENVNIIHPNDEVELPDGSTGENTSTPSTSNDTSNESLPSTSEEQLSKAEMILKLVNQERAKEGLSALSLYDPLNKVAQAKAQDMVDNNYFSHDSPKYGTPFQMMRKFGVDYTYAGENIASGQKSAQQVMNDWMNSSGHRANIMNAKFTKLGVGYVESGGKYGSVWVQQFIRP